MPTYVFSCQDCGHRFSVSVGYKEKGEVTCPRCAGKELAESFGSYRPLTLAPAGGDGDCACGTGSAGFG